MYSIHQLLFCKNLKLILLKNRPYLQPSLQYIKFQTKTCEKIGIVGRTGAGKTSLIAALFRVAPLHTGRITIDAVDISTVPLYALRSRIAMVPQDSFLFSGTVRDNLDPRHIHPGRFIYVYDVF